jgi:hypothetical protein
MPYSLRPLSAPERPSRDHIAAARTQLGAAERFERRAFYATVLLVGTMGLAGAIAWRSSGQATLPLLVALVCFVAAYVLQAVAHVRAYRARALLELLAFGLRFPAQAKQAAQQLERPLKRYETFVVAAGIALLLLPVPRLLAFPEAATMAWAGAAFVAFAVVVAGLAPHAIRQYTVAAEGLRKGPAG